MSMETLTGLPDQMELTNNGDSALQCNRPPEFKWPGHMLNDKASKSWTGNCSQEKTHVECGEDFATLMEEEQVHQDLRTQYRRDRPEDAAKETGQGKANVIVWPCHASRPDSAADATYQRPEDHRGAAEYMRQGHNEQWPSSYASHSCRDLDPGGPGKCVSTVVQQA